MKGNILQTFRYEAGSPLTCHHPDFFSTEAELLRKIRIQMRALDMLQTASSPVASSGSRADPQLRTAARTQKEKLGFLQTDFGFQPRVNPAVPDYEALYKAFQRRAAKRRDTREVTCNKPFLLRTGSLRRAQRPCDTAPSGGRRVRAQAAAGGSGPGTQNTGQVSTEGISHDIFLIFFFFKHWLSCELHNSYKLRTIRILPALPS